MIDRRKIADILYNVWKSKLSITNGSTEIESMTKAYADAKGKEIAELKASLIQAQQMYTDLLVGTTEAIAAKDAEIKRLRDGVQKEIDIQTELRETGINTGQVFDSVLKVRRCVVDALELLLSPAPVTETQNEDQL